MATPEEERKKGWEARGRYNDAVRKATGDLGDYEVKSFLERNIKDRKGVMYLKELLMNARRGIQSAEIYREHFSERQAATVSALRDRVARGRKRLRALEREVDSR